MQNVHFSQGPSEPEAELERRLKELLPDAESRKQFTEGLLEIKKQVLELPDGERKELFNLLRVLLDRMKKN